MIRHVTEGKLHLRIRHELPVRRSFREGKAFTVHEPETFHKCMGRGATTFKEEQDAYTSGNVSDIADISWLLQ